MESTVLPRDLFRASLILVLGEVPTHGYDLPGLLMATWEARYDLLRRRGALQAVEAVPAAS